MADLNDSEATVAELRERVLAFVRERDWEQFHSPKNLSMALSAEAAAEAFQRALDADPGYEPARRNLAAARHELGRD